MKKIHLLLILMLIPMVLLGGCGKKNPPTLDERIGDAGPQTVDSYEGVIQRLEALDVYQQGTHKLLIDDLKSIIIQSPTIDLNHYLNEEVLIKGKMVRGRGDAKDVFTVNEITYVDESKSAERKIHEDKSNGFSFEYPANWILQNGQGALSLRHEEKKVVSITIFSEEDDLDAFAAGREQGGADEVTIGAQRALRFSDDAGLAFYVPNPPKKKIYVIEYTPGTEARLELFYGLLDSFSLIYLSQIQGEKCGGLQQVECPEEFICQMENDGKYAEGFCVAIGGESPQASCPYIAPPAGCSHYRISEYSPRGCPSRYECVTDGSAAASASFRDLNVVETGEMPEDDSMPVNREEGEANERVEADETDEGLDYKVPDVSEVTALYVNDRKGFNLLMPKTWYYVSYGPVEGSLWKVGFSDKAFEENDVPIITLKLGTEAGGKAHKKIDSIFFVFDGPADLEAVMRKMADSVETSG